MVFFWWEGEVILIKLEFVLIIRTALSSYVFQNGVQGVANMAHIL